MNHRYQVYFGTFTDRLPFVPESHGVGIVACALDANRGRLQQQQVVGEVVNPNYLAGSGGLLFAVGCDESAESRVHAFRREADGRLLGMGSQPTGTRIGCHICTLPDGRVCVTSYLDSSIAVFPVRDGTLGPREFHWRYQGRSVNAERQEDSHAHQAVVSPDGHRLFVPDLGADCIWCHQLSGTMGEPDATPTPPGSGPRHIAFHPSLPRLYLFCELNAHLLTYDCSGPLELISDLPSLPREWQGTPAGAAIRVHPSGRMVYVSNRNSNTLDFFALCEAGEPLRAGGLASGGACPRDFAIDPTGHWLLVANQDSHRVVVHRLDPESGMPAGGEPQTFSIGSPASVLLMDWAQP